MNYNNIRHVRFKKHIRDVIRAGHTYDSDYCSKYYDMDWFPKEEFDVFQAEGEMWRAVDSVRGCNPSIHMCDIEDVVVLPKVTEELFEL